MLIFEQSQANRRNYSQAPLAKAEVKDIPEKFCRKKRPLLPEVSEMQAVRHYTRLSQMNFSIDTHFYPLGSCTMKYNPRACNKLAMLPGLLGRHPHAPESTGQGFSRVHVRIAGDAKRRHRHEGVLAYAARRRAG